MPSSRLTPRAHATCTLIAIATFPAIVVALHLVQLTDGYDGGRQAISELALGRAGWLMTVAFGALALGTYLLAVLLRRTRGGGAAVATILGLAAPLSLVSAVFHTDASGAAVTTHGRIHDAAGILTFVLMLAAMAVCSYRFGREPQWRAVRVPTRSLAVVGVVGFFLVPVLGPAHFGIAQRVLIGSFIAWMLLVATHERRSLGLSREPAVDAHEQGALPSRPS
jgi:hypothetical membrane protein